MEHGLVELPSPCVREPAVEVVGPRQQFEDVGDELCSDLQVGVDRGQLLLKLAALGVDLGQSLSDLVLGAGGLSCEVDQVRFLDLQLVELSTNLSTEQRRGSLIVIHDVDDLRSELVDEVLPELDVVVVSNHGFFHNGDGQERFVTDPLLASPAEEVEVDPAVAAGSLEDHAVLPPGLMAGAAPQAAFQVVVPDALPFTGDTLGFEHDLHSFEEVALDERFVPTGELFALVRDDADVVRVTQQRGQLAISDPGRWIAGWT